jgi:hypothetical protein
MAPWQKLGSAVFTVLLVGSLTLLILLRTDPQTVASKIDTSMPYAAIEIVPDSLQQVVIRDDRDSQQWALQYSTRVLAKKHDCAEILIKRRLSIVGAPGPFAVNEVPSRQLSPKTDTPVIVAGSEILLPGPLPPGEYVLTVEVICFVVNGGGLLAPVGQPAITSPVCFRVGLEATVPSHHRRLLSRHCLDQLGRLVVGAQPKVAWHR